VTGLIVEDGGFTELGKRPVEALTYVRLGGGKAGPSAAGGSPGKGDGKTPNELIAEAREALRKLADQYEKPATPYLSKPRAQFAGRWGDYDHLARRAEWAAALDGPSEGEDA
jgi:ATP-dependent helicase/nuclease subunit B